MHACREYFVHLACPKLAEIPTYRVSILSREYLVQLELVEIPTYRVSPRSQVDDSIRLCDLQRVNTHYATYSEPISAS